MPQSILQDRLYYHDKHGWTEVPSWVYFFLELGSTAAVSTEQGRRLVIGVALPSRLYAAATVACAIVGARSALPEGYISTTVQFERVCALPVGTHLCVLNGNRELRGIFTGRREVNGIPYAAVKFESKSEILVPVDGSWRLRVLDEVPVRIPKKQSGRLVLPLSPFARHFTGNSDAKIYAAPSQVECAIVGRLNALRREAVETEFAVSKDGHKFDKGTLQDVLRLREFVGATGFYRSTLFRLSRHSPPSIPEGQGLPFVVFDGAAGFCRWRDRMGAANWIVMLDRTETAFQDAVSILNQAYMKSDEDDRVNGLPNPPSGVEIMSFYERIN